LRAERATAFWLEISLQLSDPEFVLQWRGNAERVNTSYEVTPLCAGRARATGTPWERTNQLRESRRRSLETLLDVESGWLCRNCRELSSRNIGESRRIWVSLAGPRTRRSGLR